MLEEWREVIPHLPILYKALIHVGMVTDVEWALNNLLRRKLVSEKQTKLQISWLFSFAETHNLFLMPSSKHKRHLNILCHAKILSCVRL